MGANETQVGGAHYQRGEYQHWDFITDNGFNYLVGCATKYISRWRFKNGEEDLHKAIHYIEKLDERKPQILPIDMPKFWDFAEAANLTLLEARAIYLVCTGSYMLARATVEGLLNDTTP